MKTKSISLLCVMLIFYFLCAGVNFTLAQTTKKKSVFDKIFKPTPTATPPVSSDTPNSSSSGSDTMPDKNNGGKVSFKDDEFTGKRTVVLENLVLATDLTATLSTDIDLKTLNSRPSGRDAVSRWIADTTIIFSVPNKGQALFLSEGNRMDFMVDGERVAGNEATSSSYGSRKRGIEEVLTVMNLDRLGKVARGRDVKMKLGDRIYDIDSSAKERLKAFLKALGR